MKSIEKFLDMREQVERGCQPDNPCRLTGLKGFPTRMNRLNDTFKPQY